MTDFASIRALAQHVAGVVRPAIEAAENDGLRDGATAVAEEARRMIGHEDNGWPSPAESTIAEKSRLGYAGQVSAPDTLLRTGGLRDSIRVEIDGHSVEIGSDDPLAAYHFLGTPKKLARGPLAGALTRKLEQSPFILVRIQRR